MLYPKGFSNLQLAGYILGGSAAGALALAYVPTAQRFVEGGIAAVNEPRVSQV